MCVFSSRHQAGWFPFRPEQQNLRGGERARAPQEDAERHQDIQEMVSGGRSRLAILCLGLGMCVWCCDACSTQEGHWNYNNRILRVSVDKWPDTVCLHRKCIMPETCWMKLREKGYCCYDSQRIERNADLWITGGITSLSVWAAFLGIGHDFSRF